MFTVIKAYSFATIQVSHLALICDLAATDKDRIWLNSIRNAFTVISAICVHVALMVLLGTTNEDEIEFNDVLNSTLYSNSTTGEKLTIDFLFFRV